jgi:hypothetical protein
VMWLFLFHRFRSTPTPVDVMIMVERGLKCLRSENRDVDFRMETPLSPSDSGKGRSLWGCCLTLLQYIQRRRRLPNTWVELRAVMNAVTAENVPVTVLWTPYLWCSYYINALMDVLRYSAGAISAAALIRSAPRVQSVKTRYVAWVLLCPIGLASSRPTGQNSSPSLVVWDV